MGFEWRLFLGHYNNFLEKNVWQNFLNGISNQIKYKKKYLFKSLCSIVYIFAMNILSHKSQAYFITTNLAGFMKLELNWRTVRGVRGAVRTEIMTVWLATMFHTKTWNHSVHDPSNVVFLFCFVFVLFCLFVCLFLVWTAKN